jgi:hypothetical protein
MMAFLLGTHSSLEPLIFRQDAINAWQKYQDTGLHVTGDEVITWLDTWGEENEQSAPACHKWKKRMPAMRIEWSRRQKARLAPALRLYRASP